MFARLIVVVAAVALIPAAQQIDDTPVVPQARPAGPVTFVSVRELRQPGSGLHTQIRLGFEAASTDWPASVYTVFPTPDDTGECTAAIIGPRVLLTAAHCVPTQGGMFLTYNETLYTLTCEMHPRYAQDESADFALCHFDRDFVQPAGFRFESVDTSPMAGMLKQHVVLGGFGCTSNVPGLGPADGKYRIGVTTIVETSHSTPRTRKPEFYANAQVNNLFTSKDPNLANLCPGDSGGPAFRPTGGLNSLSQRVVVGVNSRVFGTRLKYGASLVSATGGSDFPGWAAGWLKKRSAEACGLAGAPSACRK